MCGTVGVSTYFPILERQILLLPCICFDSPFLFKLPLRPFSCSSRVAIGTGLAADWPRRGRGGSAAGWIRSRADCRDQILVAIK